MPELSNVNRFIEITPVELSNLKTTLDFLNQDLIGIRESTPTIDQCGVKVNPVDGAITYAKMLEDTLFGIESRALGGKK